MVDECLMTDECPGYDRDHQVCLLRPDDCEFLLSDAHAEVPIETPEVLTADA